jgi:ribonuclease P/MRP protein subunit RPP40
VSSVNEGNPVDVVYLDFRKAFDSVVHVKLIEKLCGYGISGDLLVWCSSFLSGRTQRVRVQDAVSGSKSVKSGVPQGSVLGPLFFLIFINDIVDIVDGETKIKLYADDIKLYRRIFSQIIDRFRLQADLSKVEEWSIQNQLSLAERKCKSISLFSTSINPGTPYILNNSDLEVVSTMRDLGIIVSDDLKPRSHIVDIVSRASVRACLIHRVFVTRQRDFLIDMFKTFVRPILESNTSLWSPCLIGDIKLVEKVQRRFTKRFPGLEEMTYEQRIVTLGLESLESRRLKFDLINVFKILHGIIPVDSSKYFTPGNAKTRGHDYKIFVPQQRVNATKFSFAVRVISSWNALPPHVVNAHSLALFKSRLNGIEILPR